MPRKVALGVLMLALTGSWGFAAQPAVAAPDRPLAEVTILPGARLTDDGAAITAKVRITCEPNGVNGIQWEGYANATQAGVFGFTEVQLDCDGRQHLERVVIPVLASPGPEGFAPGAVTVNVVIVDENTLTEHASDTRTVKAR